MCGMILAPSTFDPQKVALAMQAMGYRGADDYRGLISFKGWYLGHVRLAIQSTELVGQQPFTRGGAAMAFVGELFGLEGEETEERVFWKSFQGTCQTALSLDGFWSMIKIGETGQVWAFTDHLGVKPLYYWQEHGIVCSEIAPMFKLAPPPALDRIYLANCIKFGYDYSGRTPWQGITQVAPGTMLRLVNSGTSPRSFQYWNWEPRPEPTPEELRDLVTKAILRWAGGSNRPVGLLLSGGLDSTIVYEVLRRNGVEVSLFSVENGESQYLPQDAKTELLPDSKNPTYEEAVEVMQAPLDLGSLFPQINLSRALATTGTHVCLSGDGADELFGGYRRAQSYDSQLSDVFCELPYYHLPRLDRVMMRETIELRAPFLSPSVVSAALSVPYEKRRGKGILKEAFRGIVPDRIIDRPKLPLKSREVLEGGEVHRLKLLEAFYAKFGRPV